MNELGPIEIVKKIGSEKFILNDEDLDFDLLSFWRWSTSNIVSNATRGILAEYIVAKAIGIKEDQVREEWAAYDLISKNGTKIEVKSASFIQSWHQNTYSKISFNVRTTLMWTKEENKQSKIPKRQADVYVFALLSEKEQSKLNPLNLNQWEFYVLPTSILNSRQRSQHSITLPSLQKLTKRISFDFLKYEIEQKAIENQANKCL
jgi:hypothetical protein